MSICSMRGYSSSQAIQNLRKEIQQIDLMMKKNEEKQHKLLTFIYQSHENRRNNCLHSFSSSSSTSSILFDDDHQTWNYNNNACPDCSSNPMKYYFQRISSSKCNHLFTSLPMMTLTSIDEDYSLPIVMQGHISDQPVTLVNRSAAQLILQLKSLHVKQNLLKESFEKVAQLVAIREQQLREMTRSLVDLNEEMKSIEQLKSIETILFNQQWKETHSKINQIRSHCHSMSQLIQPNENFNKEILDKINKISRPVEIERKETTQKDKEKKKHKDHRR